MKKFSRLTAGLVSVAILLGSAYGITHRQDIFDYLALRNYAPSERIVALANDTTMKEGVRRVFYINHPALSNKVEFRSNCPSTEKSIVLGCYVQHKGIYLLDVEDERLQGVVQVTAAHEVLHAEYDRLSDNERARIDQMTADFFSRLDDDRIKKTIEQYREKDASVVPNELHSILATEVKNLSPELESYYSQYFNNRTRIVEYSENYEQTFVGLDKQVEGYDKELASLKSTIESNNLEIEGLNNEIELQKSRLDALLSSGRTEEYNASVSEFNTRVNSHNALVETTKRLVAEHNAIVEKRNAIATTEQELVEAINSNIEPQKQE